MTCMIKNRFSSVLRATCRIRTVPFSKVQDANKFFYARKKVVGSTYSFLNVNVKLNCMLFGSKLKCSVIVD
jgi:hypothetical protein